MAPGDLEQALHGLQPRTDPNLLAGFHQMDKGVYQISEEVAIIQTVDFFTPIVDDPYMYGQIAAANALSDVYAMGGVPITALNIVAFPSRDMDLGILREILRGGIDKMNEAETTLVGGHSIEDAEIKYGLAVTGKVHPKKVIRNRGAKPGDRLILTKSLGTGIINTAMKAGVADANIVSKVQTAMATLNRAACQVMLNFHVHACTDVTGFGLIGHLAEMLNNSRVGAVIKIKDVPHFSEAIEYAREDLVPGGTCRNREFREEMVVWDEAIAEEYRDLCYDAQTSGGLLIAVAREDADALLRELHTNGVVAAQLIGEIIEDANCGCQVEL